MKDHISGNVSVFSENKNVDAVVNLINIEDSIQIKSISWSETLEAMAVDGAKKGQVQFAKAWNDKPAKMLQWYKEDKSIRFEIWCQVKGAEWTFKNEYTISLSELEAFEPIHNYNLQMMASLKKDFSDETLGGTSFLTRD